MYICKCLPLKKSNVKEVVNLFSTNDCFWNIKVDKSTLNLQTKNLQQFTYCKYFENFVATL